MAAMEPSEFFKKKRDASEIKSEIINKYFNAWCGIILFGQKWKTIKTVLYIDLFSGPGYYDDEDSSTPIKVLYSIFKSTGSRCDLNNSVQTFFNDSDRTMVASLQQNIEKLPYYDKLVHKPIILNEDANYELLTRLLNTDHPALTFIDPFGYSFSQKMLLLSVKKWGSDLFMLFNFNRIRSAVKNSTVDSLMHEIFGNRLDHIRDFYSKNRNANKREEFIMDNFEGIFRDRGYRTFKFRINFPHRKQTSHYLIFVSRVDLACTKIKEIMMKYSDYQEDGVPLFGANLKQTQTSLFHDHYKYSIINLIADLVNKADLFNNKTVEMIYEKHNVGTNYIKDNYKTAYERLKLQDKVEFFNAKTGQIVNKFTYTCVIRYK